MKLSRRTGTSVIACVIGGAAAVSGPVARADVRVPAIFGDNMVLQQKADVAVWGWASMGEKVEVTGSWPGGKADAVAGERGRWLVHLRTPAAGGPFTVTVSGVNTITFSNVLIGEVWVCSGQSNMEMSVAASRDGAAEAGAAKFPKVRLFTVENTISVPARGDVSGRWVECGPETVGGFSAVGYYFGRELHRTLGVPVGLIDSDWGGTPAEAWTSPRVIKEFPEFAPAMAQLALLDPDPTVRAKNLAGFGGGWWTHLAEIGKGAPGKEWSGPGFGDNAWKTMNLPASISGDLEKFDGVVFFRREVDIPAAMAGKDATLELGPIDDRDEAYLNGVRVGATHEDGRWNAPRKYPVPGELLQAGRNVVSVLVLDTGGIAGINGKPEQMVLRSSDAGATPISLAGPWKYLVGPAKSDLPPMRDTPQVTPNTPTALYQGMIAPIIPYGIKGVIWYQGESNRYNPELYSRLFPAMIRDWREDWGLGEFPFYFVQIAPFNYGGDRGETAELREAQLKTMQSVPHTGMVVTMDIGNPADIHPANKQDVGRRLALWALAKDYGKADVTYGGPVYKSMRIDGDAAVVTFDHTGKSGLAAQGGGAGNFLIAGEDRRFFPAKAAIENASTVRVSSPKVGKPAAVRYAWEPACQPDLFNSEHLPASPFRTDDWARSTVTIDDGGSTQYLSKDPAMAPLFSGKDLAGWVNVNCAPGTFTVRNSMIFCTGHPTGVLRTEKQYENFVLEAEWRHLEPKGNSGIFIWSDALTARGQPFTRAVEVQVMDGLEGEGYTSDGDIFPIHGARMTPENGRGKGDRAFPTEKRMRPSPEWNHYLITCEGGAISLAVNGKVVTRGKDISPRKGYICLESEGSPIEFRNLRIKELPSSPTPPGPTETGAPDEGFVSLYNGLDFAGWKFGKEHEGHFKSVDWTINFDGKGEDLWSEKSYKDFVLICDWRWTAKPENHDLPIILPSGEYQVTPDGKQATTSTPEAGDSGIYLRGNSKSQVNIWCWPIGSGEVYGYRTDSAMAPAVRAGVTPKVHADAGIGEWNRFIITMKGDRLTVNLNGKVVIEDAELPGVPREGPIALQKHDGAIEFANIYIKELK